MAQKLKSPKAGSLGRVLLVEDDAILALALEAALLDGGAAAVAISSTVREAMTQLDADSFDSIVLDVHLADRDDGWALADVISLLGVKRPRIAFSTGAPEDIPPEVAAMGPVFTKPYDPRDLVEELRIGTSTGLIARLRDAFLSDGTSDHK